MDQNSQLKDTEGLFEFKGKKKKDLSTCCLHKTHFRRKDTQSEKEKIEKHFNANINKKKVGLAILISEKEDFKTKTIKDKEE